MVMTTLGTSYEAEFWDSILDDDELVRAEFEALIAAEWPSRVAMRLRAVERLSDGSRHKPSLPGSRASGGTDVPDVNGWRRERSPPKADSPVVGTTRKAGEGIERRSNSPDQFSP
ncbi:MAG: hypothetical protein JWO63_3054 [Frankiales bacterium]|nr:hypothetical protein [Frankiales bacterium]